MKHHLNNLITGSNDPKIGLFSYFGIKSFVFFINFFMLELFLRVNALYTIFHKKLNADIVDSIRLVLLWMMALPSMLAALTLLYIAYAFKQGIYKARSYGIIATVTLTCCVLAQNLLLLSRVIRFDSINPIECLHVALGSASVALLESNATGFKVAAFNALMFILFLFTDVAAHYSDEPIFASSGVFAFQAVGFAALLYCSNQLVREVIQDQLDDTSDLPEDRSIQVYGSPIVHRTPKGSYHASV